MNDKEVLIQKLTNLRKTDLYLDSLIEDFSSCMEQMKFNSDRMTQLMSSGNPEEDENICKISECSEYLGRTNEDIIRILKDIENHPELSDVDGDDIVSIIYVVATGKPVKTIHV